MSIGRRYWRNASQGVTLKNAQPHHAVSAALGVAARSIVRKYNSGVGTVLERKIKSTKKAEWVPRGRAVEVAGRTIPGGLIYLNAPVGISNGILDQTIPSEIPAGVRLSELIGEGRHYRTFYELEVLARRAYIDWLSTSRDYANSPIAFVLLYLYQLERRLMADEPQGQVDTLLEEIGRIGRHFGSNKLVASRVAETTFAWRLAQDAAGPVDFRLLDCVRPVAFRIRAAVGERLCVRNSLDADSALVVTLVLHQQTSLVRESYFGSIADRFRTEFDREYRDGLPVATSHLRRLPVYRYVSGDATFEVEIAGVYRHWPDFPSMRAGQVSKPWQILKHVWDDQ